MKKYEERILFLDESYSSKVMVVGGFAVNRSDLPLIESAWMNLKTEVFEISPEHELKSTYGSRDSTREALERNGWSQQLRVPRMLMEISKLPIEIFSDILIDERIDAALLDWYIDGFKWCVRRYGNSLPWRDVRSDLCHQVVIDTPQRAPKINGRRITPARLEMFSRTDFGSPQLLFEEMCSVGETYGSRQARALKDKGLSRKLEIQRASTSNALQIADVICGTVRKFAEHSVNPEIKTEFTRSNLGIVAAQYRAIWTGSGLNPINAGFGVLSSANAGLIATEFLDIHSESILKNKEIG